MFRFMNRRLATAVLVGAGVVLAVAGCGGQHGGGHPAASAPSTASVPPAADRNDADVAFARDMIPHHRQAIEMSALAETRAVNPTVKDLAVRIKKAQDPEITQLSGWLRGWGQPVLSAAPGDGHGGHAGMPGMPGMMSDAEMTALKAASGKDFDRMFLQMMIRHHQGAIEMAKTEMAKGINPPAKLLAESISSSQAAEVTEMQNLLRKL